MFRFVKSKYAIINDTCKSFLIKRLIKFVTKSVHKNSCFLIKRFIHLFSMGTSKTHSFIFNRRLKIIALKKETKKSVDDFVYDMAKKFSVSKVTIYNDFKFIRNNPKDFQNETI